MKIKDIRIKRLFNLWLQFRHYFISQGLFDVISQGSMKAVVLSSITITSELRLPI
ncbi:hypothetical protein [Paenibacillus sophorae]|uniref:hypothetical protein n=1 Tax=Paenibacillus sophorae TaxID=1333845 RepID=UPI001FE561F0|nr:hypothetical protein [Paenibacillus sophorae]